MGVLGGRKDAPHFTFLLTASGQALSQKPVGTRAHDVVSLGETDNVLCNPSSRTFAPSSNTFRSLVCLFKGLNHVQTV